VALELNGRPEELEPSYLLRQAGYDIVALVGRAGGTPFPSGAPSSEAR
jgi:hypothetical protein